MKRKILSTFFLLSVTVAAAPALIVDDTQASFGAPVDGALILMYHGLDEPHGFNPESFEPQMKYLSDYGYNTITLDHLASWIETGAPPLPERPIVLTFDDNYITVYSIAYPVMAKYGLFGYNFAHTLYVGVPPGTSPATGYDHADWDEIREMDAAGVMFTGSHTVTHRNLTSLSPSALQDELVNSKVAIEQELGKASPHLAYPYGAFNASVIAATEAAGYETAVTTNSGINTRETPLMELHRHGVSPNPASSGTAVASSFIRILSTLETTGGWTVSTSTSGYLGEGYHFAQPGSDVRVATWKFAPQSTQRYRVYARWTAFTNRATNAPYTVYHAEGSDLFRVNQQENGGTWNLLGTFSFEAGEEYRVTLTNEADAIVVADAVWFEPVFTEGWQVF